jgi:biopolymer transport protein ExbB
LEVEGRVRAEAGAFFDRTGEYQDGTLWWIGRVAAYGVAPEEAGALLPAGEGRLMLAADDGTARAAAQAFGRPLGSGDPVVDPLHLFESLQRVAADTAEATWFETIQKGGAVAWVIVGLGLLGLVLVLLRGFMLWRGGHRREATFRRAVGHARHSDVRRWTGDATALSQALDVVWGHAAGHGGVGLDDIAAERVSAAQTQLDRFSTAILVFAAVAPLLGLLGTVTGMIATFDVITEVGTGNPKLLSGGISEALITTQLGLIVAIPLLLAGHLLKAQASRVLGHLERGVFHICLLLQQQDKLSVAEDESPECQQRRAA